MKGTKRRSGWRRSLRDRAEFAGLVVLAWLMTALPAGSASAAMGFLWQRIGPLTARHRRIGRNLSVMMPELSEPERKAISAAQWNNLGRTFAESIRLKPLAAEPDRFEVVMSDALDQQLHAADRGVIFVLAHLANWECSGALMRRYGPPMGLYQRLSNPFSDRFVRKVRERAFSGPLLPKGPDTPVRVMRWVRSGGCVGMLADLYERRGTPATFFGQPTLANPFPAMLARRLGAPLVSVRTVRLAGARFRLELEALPVPQTNDVASDVQTATQAMLDRFESWIRERPGEWMWVQKRWSGKGLQPGTPATMPHLSRPA